MSKSRAAPDLRREIRTRSDAYEEARSARIAKGEQIHARLREVGRRGQEDSLLESIREGEVDGPVPALGCAYRESCAEELAAGERLRKGLESHPAWAWLAHVDGVTPTLAGRLLGKLDVTRAETPSSFWAYCGLATVAGPDGARMAQPSRGNEETKRLCHQLGDSLLGANSAYARQYRLERRGLDETRPGWPAQRKHLTSLRKMEKLFLAHLWLVWREALGLPITEPHEHDARAKTRPWDMVQPARLRWLRNTPPQPPRILVR